MTERKSVGEKLMTQLNNSLVRSAVRRIETRLRKDERRRRTRTLKTDYEPVEVDVVADSSGYDFLPVAGLIKSGDLQELNRNWLHPQGKELVVLERPDGSLYIAGIIDCGDNPDDASFQNGVDKSKVSRVARNFAKHYAARFKKFGNPVQPVRARRKK